MNLRVNHEGLNEFYDLSNNESEYLKEKIEFWLEKIEELREIWQGIDADEFYENAKHYFEKMKIIPEFYDSVNDFTIKANRVYKNVDEESKKDFKKAIDDRNDVYV